MARPDINRVIITGNLTADPEIRQLPSGTTLGRLRIVTRSRRKGDDGWHDKANYFDVVVWGSQAENAARYLRKGRSIVIDGRLDWREWETEDGKRRRAVEIVAETIQYLPEPGRSTAPVETDAIH